MLNIKRNQKTNGEGRDINRNLHPIGNYGSSNLGCQENMVHTYYASMQAIETAVRGSRQKLNSRQWL
jgi:hypothetical protein